MTLSERLRVIALRVANEHRDAPVGMVAEAFVIAQDMGNLPQPQAALVGGFSYALRRLDDKKA